MIPTLTPDLPATRMRRLLINPNTSVHITERLAASARLALHAGDTLKAITAVQGPAVVSSAAGLREADDSAMALADAHAAGHDALVLGISLDGAAPRLRERHPHLPIVGMTEAALMTACLRAERVGLLTLGAPLLPLYRERVGQIGLDARVVAYEAPEAPVAFNTSTQLLESVVLDVLADACARLQQAGAQAVVLAGAVLCGYADALSSRRRVPVFDGVACAVGQVRILLARGEQPRFADGPENPHAA